MPAEAFGQEPARAMGYEVRACPDMQFTNSAGV